MSQALNVSTAARVADFKRNYLPYPMASSIADELEQLFACGSVGQDVGASARTYLLIGDPGSGKTALLRRFCRKHPKVEEAGRDVYPVLYVEVPPKTTRKALAARILSALGALAPTSATEIALTARALGHLRDQGVKVLVLDEAQHLFNEDRRRLNYEIADWVKGIVNDGACSVLLAGVSEAWEAYRYNGQLKRRSFGNRQLSALRPHDPVQWSTFLGLLKAYEGKLPFTERSGLTERLTALRINRQVCGLVGRLSDFISDALTLALDKGLPCLTTEVLSQIAERQRDLGDPDWRNPFKMDEPTLLGAEATTMHERRALGHERTVNIRKGKRTPKQKDILG